VGGGAAGSELVPGGTTCRPCPPAGHHGECRYHHRQGCRRTLYFVSPALCYLSRSTKYRIRLRMAAKAWRDIHESIHARLPFVHSYTTDAAVQEDLRRADELTRAKSARRAAPRPAQSSTFCFCELLRAGGRGWGVGTTTREAGGSPRGRSYTFSALST
jgi:hypothetical protein